MELSRLSLKSYKKPNSCLKSKTEYGRSALILCSKATTTKNNYWLNILRNINLKPPSRPPKGGANLTRYFRFDFTAKLLTFLRFYAIIIIELNEIFISQSSARLVRVSLRSAPLCSRHPQPFFDFLKIDNSSFVDNAEGSALQRPYLAFSHVGAQKARGAQRLAKPLPFCLNVI